MLEVKSGYLIEMSHVGYGAEKTKEHDFIPTFCLAIPSDDDIMLIQIESYYDETCQLCHKLSDWVCDASNIKKSYIHKIYGRSNCGRLMDIRNRKLLYENLEDNEC